VREAGESERKKEKRKKRGEEETGRVWPRTTARHHVEAKK
jgi:hypothetical protein